MGDDMVGPIADEPDSPTEKYSGSVAVKKIAWALGKFAMAEASTSSAIAAFEKVCGYLQPYGITVIVDKVILGQVLPGLIFMGLVAIHDAVKTKTNLRWL